MSKSVFARVLIKNHVQLLDIVHKEFVPCGAELATILGEFWLVPVEIRGRLGYYKPVISTTKPTIDSVKSVKVQANNGFTYFVALLDTGTAADFANACEACCGATPPAMPDVTVPNLYPEQNGCQDPTTLQYSYFFLVPALAAGKQYSVYGSSNGAALAPDPGVTHFASVAAFITWANANWAAYGTFAAVGQKVTWTSASAVSGSLVFNQV